MYQLTAILLAQNVLTIEELLPHLYPSINQHEAKCILLQNSDKETNSSSSAQSKLSSNPSETTMAFYSATVIR